MSLQPFIWVKWPIIAKKFGSLGILVAVLILAESREKLLKNNLFDTQGEYDSTVICDQRSLESRTEDGTCNNLDIPQMGAAGVRFGRNVDPKLVAPESDAQLITPNPRLISRELMTRENFQAATTLNFIAAAWIQFMVHDWVSHGTNSDENPIRVPLAADDPFASSELLIKRSNADTGIDPRSGVTTFRNVNTHWWDGSQIYGSDRETNSALRSYVDGKLKVTENNRLPKQWNGIPKTGFSDNWWLGLSMLHHIFTLEHNAIAERLKATHPDWNDQKLYDKARLINAALMAKIHTVEWTPAILANPVLEKAMNANWYGLIGENKQKSFQNAIRSLGQNLQVIDQLVAKTTGVDPKLSATFASRGDLERAVGGIVGSRTTDLYTAPYTLTEEFVSVYRMHPLLRDTVNVFDLGTGQELVSIELNETRNGQAEVIMDEYSLENLWYSFGVTHPGSLTLQNYPKFLQNLDIPLVGQIDLATTDIIRDRERGVPRYNSFRRLVGLKPISSFEQLTSDKVLLEKLKRIYNNDIEQIDLLVGSLAETVRPDGFGFGETSFQIFIVNASRRLMSDRFFTVDYRPEVYTKEGLQWIDDTSMVSLLKRHIPQLTEQLHAQENAFKPWKK